MPKLHLVGFTTDLKNLVLATRRGSKSGSYLIPVDERLRRTLREISRLEEEKGDEPTAPTDTNSSKLTPKEIQNLLRVGRTPEQVAKLAEADITWIEKFTSPVLAEMAGVITRVRSATLSKRRLGVSAAPVGDAIEANLAQKGVKLDDETAVAGWSARRRGDVWEVSFKYVSRGRNRTASFGYDPGTREVSTLNSVAIDVGWLAAPVRRRRPAAAKRKPAKRRTTKRKPAKRRTTKRKPAKRRTTKRKPARAKPRTASRRRTRR